jgi:AcrR family transcriptional regulator
MRRHDKSDRRTQRTNHKLTEAMVELITEKRFDDVTVQNLIDRADVGRSTFYSHYRDKQDLFRKNWERFIEMLAQMINWENAGRSSFMPVTFLFEHLRNVHPFYRGMRRSGMLESVYTNGVRTLKKQIEPELTARVKVDATIPVAILSDHLVNQLFVLLRWWLEQGMPYTPERMDQIYHDLVMPTLQSQIK